VPLEELHLAFVLFGRRASAESAEIATPARLRVLFARVEPVLTRFEFPNHAFALLPLAELRRPHAIGEAD
jgi:hypothetical protein